jgi:hypothetical protein
MSVAGVVAVLFSNSVVFVLVPAGALLALSAWDREDWFHRLSVVAWWAVCVVAAIWWGRRSMSPVDTDYMHLFWAPDFGPWTLRQVPVWTWHRLSLLSGTTGASVQGNMMYSSTVPIVIAMVCGGLLLLWRDWRRCVLLAGPLFMVIAAACLRQYPFVGRLALFLFPFLVILATAALDGLARMVPQKVVAAFIPFVLVPTAVAAAVTNRVPLFHEHVRPVLEYVQQQRQPADAFWVYYGAGSAFRYYQHLLPLEGQLSVCDREHPRGQIQHVDAMRGHPRVWVIVSHAGANSTGNERIGLIDYLDQIGIRRAVFPESFDRNAPVADSFAFLYDLSQSERLMSASAASFPVPELTGPEWSCYGTMTPDATGFKEASEAVRRAAH